MLTKTNTIDVIKMARYSRRTSWRSRPLYNTRVPFEDGFSVGSHNNRMKQIKSEPYVDRKRYLPTNEDGSPRMPKKPYDRPKNKMWTNDNVAAAGVAGVGAAGVVGTAGGIAIDKLNSSIASGIEEGFAGHKAAQESGFGTYDALTESAMAGRWLSRIEASAGRMLPLVEELLDIAIAV